MWNAMQRLSSLRVGDIQNTRVVAVPACNSMADAAKTMIEAGVSGAPVLNERNMLVGMVSAFDFMRKIASDNGYIASDYRERLNRFVERDWGHEWTNADRAPAELVGFHMSPAVQGIADSATLLQAAQVMCAQHVHRLPVLNQHGELAGMITSLDIVAALLNALEEAKQTHA